MTVLTHGFMDTVVNAKIAPDKELRMPMNVEKQLADLRKLTPKQLREKYLEVFGEPSRSGNKAFLYKRVAWRIQSLAEGTLSERARRRAAELAQEADIRTTVPRVATPGSGPTTTAPYTAAHDGRLPPPGAILTRKYKGRTIEVTVLPKGYAWDGDVYRSLSAVARAITGSTWSGPKFFGLDQEAN